MVKKIRAITYQYIEGAGWADVWLIYWKGRKRVRKGPTFMSLTDAEGELRQHDWCKEKRPTWYDANEEATNIARVAKIKAEGYVIEYPESGTPNIYTRAEWLDKKEIERMIAFFLRDVGDFTNPDIRVVWAANRLGFRTTAVTL